MRALKATQECHGQPRVPPPQSRRHTAKSPAATRRNAARARGRGHPKGKLAAGRGIHRRGRRDTLYYAVHGRPALLQAPPQTMPQPRGSRVGAARTVAGDGRATGGETTPPHTTRPQNTPHTPHLKIARPCTAGSSGGGAAVANGHAQTREHRGTAGRGHDLHGGKTCTVRRGDGRRATRHGGRKGCGRVCAPTMRERGGVAWGWEGTRNTAVVPQGAGAGADMVGAVAVGV